MGKERGPTRRACGDVSATTDSNVYHVALESVLVQLVQNLSLPRFEMDPFDGSPGDIYRFVTAFNTHVKGQISVMSPCSLYLLNYCRGPARSAIEHCALLPPNEVYTEALRIL